MHVRVCLRAHTQMQVFGQAHTMEPMEVREELRAVVSPLPTSWIPGIEFRL